MKKIEKPLGKFLNALGIAIISCLIVFLDSLFCAYVFPNNLFIWIAFASWTIFFTSSTKERLKSLPGYIIGMLASIAIIYLGSAISSFMNFTINGISATSCFATLLVVFCIMLMYEFKLLNFTSISSVFVGIWVIFSGLGATIYPNSVKDTLIIFAIVICYSIVGLIAGWLSMIIYKLTDKIYVKNNEKNDTQTK